LAQYTNITDRIDRQTGQWSDSIGQTVLQMVAQKHVNDITPQGKIFRNNTIQAMRVETL